MHYLSTRGQAPQASFCDILLEGLASDGGLYLPVHYPQVSVPSLHSWRGLSYAELAYEVMALYIDDIPAQDLKALCQKTYTAEVFGTADIAPLYPLKATSLTLENGGKTKEEGDVYLLGLSNGPTLAFKDMAMQFLGHVFEYQMERTGRSLNILGATSGDTGSAAEYALRGKKGIRVFMTSPQGRMSNFQRAQMFSLMDSNIHNLAIEGVFDDCQDLVKTITNDASFKQRYHLGAVNSINWARLLAQVVYYFWGYLRATDAAVANRASATDISSTLPSVDFAVPSGNFGNVCAGHVARQMGLPIGRLIVATNENNVLDEFFKTGIYQPRTREHTLATSSPSMDISKASNFERFIFDLLGKDPQQLCQGFVEPLQNSGVCNLSQQPSFANIAEQFGLVSGKSTHAKRISTIRSIYQNYQKVVDPHTADALQVASEYQRPGQAMVVLETALPTKFETTIQEALGFVPQRPAQWANIEDLAQRVQLLPLDVNQLKEYIATVCDQG